MNKGRSVFDAITGVHNVEERVEKHRIHLRVRVVSERRDREKLVDNVTKTLAKMRAELRKASAGVCCGVGLYYGYRPGMQGLANMPAA